MGAMFDSTMYFVDKFYDFRDDIRNVRLFCVSGTQRLMSNIIFGRSDHQEKG